MQEDIDRYGRVVASVYVGNEHVNAALLRQGAAWVYRQYAHDESLYAIEQQAKAARLGLWSLPKSQQIPPWEWRHAGVKAESEVPTPTQKFECGSKRYCKEMSSCEEARYYLEHCGLSRLDGDKDGTPCESLCQ